MPPIRRGDGTSLTPKGIAEVRKGDGTILYSAGSAIPDSGVSRLTLDDADTSGTTALDVWDGNDGTINGATTGITGANATYTTDEAYSFDGVDDYVTLGNSADFDSVSAISVAAWIRLDSLPDDSGFALLNKYWDGSDRSWFIDYRDSSSVSVSKAIRFLLATDSENQNNEVYVEDTVSANTWFHVCMTWGASSDTIRAYIDGTKQGTASSVGTQVRSNSTDLILGARKYAGSIESYAPVDIDDFRLYHKQLTDTEVSNLRNTGSISG